jgi:serine/threonine-protein kinase RsbW
MAPFRHQFSPQSAAVPLARHLLKDWLDLVPVDPEAVDSLLLAVSELCSNAVRHATGAPGSIQLHAWAEAADVVVEVSDDGGSLEWSEQRPEDLPDPEAEQGRGLFLVRELADEVVTAVEHGRTVVRIIRRAVVGGRVEEIPTHSG